MVKSHNYQAIDASKTAEVVGAAAVGVLLERLIITVATAATGTVALIDGDVSIPLIAANTPIGVYIVELGLRSKVTPTEGEPVPNPGWKITTGAGASVLAVFG